MATNHGDLLRREGVFVANTLWLCPVHFLLGIGIGTVLDRFWKPPTKEQLAENPAAVRAQLAFEMFTHMIAMSLLFIWTNRLLFAKMPYFCQRCPQNLNPHGTHNGFSFFFGLAWSSPNLYQKVQLFLGTG